ncbi:MAG: FABP family protein [Actinomycetota bacterium]
MALAVDPQLLELSFLLGVWRGEGEGAWPGAEPFTYGEELTFEHVGDAFLLYAQRSWSLDDESPIHFERGFLRPAGPGRVELVLAHPIGVTEVAEGTVHDGVIDTVSTAVGLTGSASPVTELTRRIEVVGDELRYELHMATRDVALISHVRSHLSRA